MRYVFRQSVRLEPPLVVITRERLGYKRRGFGFKRFRSIVLGRNDFVAFTRVAAMDQDRSLPTPGRPSTAAQQSRLQPKKRPLSYAPRNSAILRRRMHSTGPDENDDYGDDRAIRQFLDEIPVVPKLPQMPDVRKYAGKGKTTGAHRNNKAGDRMSIIKNYMYVASWVGAGFH